MDTNVAIAANGRNTHADAPCQLRCIEELEEIRTQRVVVVDDGRLIFDEYRARLEFAGAPGVGDKFFKHVVNHLWDENRVRRVPITLCRDDRRGFEELPVNTLDRSDRKFLAAAVVGSAAVVNATDSDWSQQQQLTERLGVAVRQLCPQHASKQTFPAC